MGALLSCGAMSLGSCAVSMGCTCLSSLLNSTLSQATRLGHLLIILFTFTLAIILGLEYPDKINGYYNSYTKINLTNGCDPGNINECIYRQLIYRASFSLIILFTLLAILSYSFEFADKSLWILKFGSAVGIFIAFFWVDNTVFSGFAELARVLSFLWLLVQGLLFLDFSHDLHDMMMTAVDEEERSEGSATALRVVYIVLSVIFLTCSGVGLAYLFRDYTNCQLGMFFTILTLFTGVILTVVSLLNTVNKGLLTPCLMFAYSVFLCWYALLSSPEQQCNPYATANWGAGKTGAVIIVASISLLTLSYCIINGTKTLNVFNPEGEGVIQSYTGPSVELKSVLMGEDSNRLVDGGGSSQSAENMRMNSSSGKERMFFHILMILFCSYISMIITSWGDPSGVSESAGHLRGTESMWLKICSQWVFLLLYMKVLHTASNDLNN
mmetsp:Transcript_10258/g.9928  ORF Transcript_10258/g.9928 Transcript_10258/m.9928 type:complete len:440 (-) Transcript_10258:143-1462(-)